MTDDVFRTISLSDPRFEVEGLRHVVVKSQALRGRGEVTVWAPDGPPPVALVLLLHGVYGSHWSWTLKGGAHRTAARLVAAGELPPVALAMPSDGLRGDGTGYLRHGDGFDVERWIVHDVPLATCAALPTLDPQVPRFIAGLSMGGFGALRLGAKYATSFRGISAHSAITHLSEMSSFIEEDATTFGAPVADWSVLDAIERAGSDLPPLRFDCGTADNLLEGNRALHVALEARGIAHSYDEFAGGHEWPYWEAHVEDTFRFVARILAGDLS